MNTNITYPLKRGLSGDNNHWYSSTYWISNRHKHNNCGLPHNSVANKEIDNVNIVRSDGYSFRHNVWPSLTDPKSRMDSSQTLKRLNDLIEETANQKRLKINDPFKSPNSMVKDFRLTNGRNSVDPTDDLYCQSCQKQCQSSLDFSNHLSERRHKTNKTSTPRTESRDRHKKTNAYNQLHRLLKQSKESVVGLDYIRETAGDYFTCDLCRCYQMTVNNAIQHIKGCRHQRNFMAQKRDSENKRKKREERERHSSDRSAEREKRRTTERRSVCSATQTCDKSSGGDRIHTPRRSEFTATSGHSSGQDRTQNQNICESEFEKLDSHKKTIENFRTIREICDQMIGYYSQKQNPFTNMSPKNRSLAVKTLECLSSQIKKEN